jgi:hypothetical protein
MTFIPPQGLAVLALAFATAVPCSDGWCEQLDGGDGAPNACPANTRIDRARTDFVLQKARTNPTGKRLLGRIHRAPLVCYGDVPEGVLQEPGVIVLGSDRSVAANAARLAHLLCHRIDGLPFDEQAARTSTRTCEALAARAERMERRAWRIENDMRHAFGLPAIAEDTHRLQYQERCESLRQGKR